MFIRKKLLSLIIFVTFAHMGTPVHAQLASTGNQRQVPGKTIVASGVELDSQSSDFFAGSGANPFAQSNSSSQDKLGGGLKTQRIDISESQTRYDSSMPNGGQKNLFSEDPPNQFQKFIQDSTGVLLPIYGSRFFDSPQNYAVDTSLAVPSNYKLGPGDEFQLQIWGAIDFSSQITIDKEGKIVLPKVGVVHLAGVASENLEQTLNSHLSKIFTNFGLSATLGRVRSVQVYVVGQARQPGAHMVSGQSTLVNVLFSSGGPNSNGSMRNIELRRAGRVIAKVDLYEFFTKGDKKSDISILPGDVVFIPPASIRVAVMGAYDQSAIYEITNASTSIGDVLALGGGVSPVANARKALLERINPGRVPPRQVVDIALDEIGLKQVLVGGDVVTLLPVSAEFSNAVTLQGVVSDPLRYRWFEGMKVSDLIPDKESLITQAYLRRKNNLTRVDSSNEVRDLNDRMRSMAEQINWDYAVVERLSKVNLSPQLIPFNLAKAVIEREQSNNILLMPGDVVTVISQKDLAIPQEKQSRLVRVEGEVITPGIYQAFPGETLPQLIKRIGGVTPQAYLFGLEFTRESVRRRQKENMDGLIRRLEGELKGQVKVGATSNAQEAAAAAALLQQQQMQIKSEIARLKALNSNGRLTLELDVDARALAALPALPLEDGDRITIPATPGYVSALGAVYNENVMIYKNGKTVSDLMRSAGITDDAEMDGIFLLRADGSVLSKKSKSNFFGSGFDSMPVLPGDTLVAPAKLDKETGYAFTIRALKDWTQIFSNLGIGAAAIKTLRN